MNLRFDTPKHGWMRVQVEDIELNVSDVPCDSLLHLTSVIARVMSGSPSESVEWSLEPEYAKWLFDRSGDELEFRVEADSRSVATLVERGSVEHILDQIISALSDLQVNPCWSQDGSGTRIWSWPFPSTELKRLKEKRAEQADASRTHTR